MLIGAGTGLGVAYLLAGARGPEVIAGEGGHIGFAPADEEQAALLAYLRPQLGRVTAEHVLSGAGLARLYGFACRHRGSVPDDVRDEGAAAVARRFAAGEAEAVRALRLFASIFGVVAGDHALCVLATGAYSSPAVSHHGSPARSPKAASSPRSGRRTRMSPLMARMPVYLVCDDRLGLRGAALRAIR